MTGDNRVEAGAGAGERDLLDLRAAERSHRFLLALGDRLRPLTAPADILASAAAMLGAELGVNRAGYAEVEPDGTLVIGGDWTDGTVKHGAGRRPIASFGAEVIAMLYRGETQRIEDTFADPRVGPAQRPAMDEMSIAAAVTVPLVKDGRLVAMLSVHQNRARRWTDAEVRLVEEVAERTWSALERARAEARLRESEAQLQVLAETRAVLLSLEDRLRPLKEPIDILVTVSETLGRQVGANRAGYCHIDGDAFVVEHVWTDGSSPDSLGRHPLAAFDPAIIASLERGETFVCEDVRAEPRLQDVYRSTYLDLGVVALITKPLHKGGKLVAIMTVNQGWPRTWSETEVRLVDEIAERAWASLARARAEAELARSRDALHQSEKLTALGALLAGVSHELNNPLSVVIGQSFLLEEGTAGTPHAERAAKIRRAAERCAKIVRTFLAMARQNPPSRAPVDVNGLVRAALDLTDYGLRTAGVRVETDLAEGLAPLSADADQLHQVLANLLVNAQHALQDVAGPRVLSVSTRPGPEPGTVEIEVADNGPGVTVEARRRLFEPFFTTKPQGAGTGLGLSFSHGVIEAHGGRIELLERPSGAAFRVTLPCAADPATPRPDPCAAAAKEPGAGAALVVDDEPEIADMLAELLRRRGYRVSVAANGAEGKARLQDADFALILSDLRMPDVDGPALFDWMRRNRPELCERVGFVTGDTLGGAVARFLAECGRPCLEKPFTPDAVARLVEAIEARRLQPEASQ